MQIILGNIESRGSKSWPTNRESYDHWYAKLKPLCDHARQFIKSRYASDAGEKREHIWRDYLYGTLEPKEKHRAIEWTEKVSTLALVKQIESFMPYRLVPKEVFFDLAHTKMSSGNRRPIWKPAEVARRYACKIAGISESAVSHRSVRSKIE